jgi:hypothetical protein
VLTDWMPRTKLRLYKPVTLILVKDWMLPPHFQPERDLDEIIRATPPCAPTRLNVMSQEINIAKLDKAELLAALYNRAKPQDWLGWLQYRKGDMTPEAAGALLDTRDSFFARGATEYDGCQSYTEFHSVKGRVLNVDIGGDTLDATRYDGANGNGAAAMVVARLRGGETKEASGGV